MANDDALIAKLTRLAYECGDAEIKAWIGKHLAETVRGRRGKRRRGLAVTLPQARGARAVLDEARVYELAATGNLDQVIGKSGVL